MEKPASHLIGAAIGAVWAVLVVWVPSQGPQPFIPINLALIYAFVPGGLVMLLIILRQASRGVLGDATEVEQSLGATIDRRVLSGTVEQMVLALLLWPFAMASLGAVTVIVMGLAMGFARLAFWIGSHVSPQLRLFGWAASFFPTVLATVWALWKLLT